MTNQLGESILKDLLQETQLRIKHILSDIHTPTEILNSVAHSKRIYEAIQVLLQIRKLKSDFKKTLSKIETEAYKYDKGDIQDLVSRTRDRYFRLADELAHTFMQNQPENIKHGQQP